MNGEAPHPISQRGFVFIHSHWLHTLTMESRESVEAHLSLSHLLARISACLTATLPFIALMFVDSHVFYQFFFGERKAKLIALHQSTRTHEPT